MTKIVPFGKYKGQPAEVMAADRDYCDWLMAQPWFAERFRDVYNIVINYGGEPEETPEHNALQARFLDEEFCNRLAALVLDFRFEVRHVDFEAGGWDAVLEGRVWYTSDDGKEVESIGRMILVECKPMVGDDYPAILRQMRGYKRLYGEKRVLLIGAFSAQGATLDQVKAIFGKSGIAVVMLEDVDSTA